MSGDAPGTNDMVVIVHEATTTPFIESVAYTDSGDSSHHIASSRSVMVSVTDVPEPATLLPLTPAFAAVLRARRRRGRFTPPMGPVAALAN